MRLLQLLTLALLSPMAFADFVILNSTIALSSASYSCINVDGGGASMHAASSDSTFQFGGAAMEGPIDMPCLQLSGGIVHTTTSLLDSMEETDSIDRQLITPWISLLGDTGADMQLSIYGPDIVI